MFWGGGGIDYNVFQLINKILDKSEHPKKLKKYKRNIKKNPGTSGHPYF